MTGRKKRGTEFLNRFRGRRPSEFGNFRHNSVLTVLLHFLLFSPLPIPVALPAPSYSVPAVFKRRSKTLLEELLPSVV